MAWTALPLAMTSAAAPSFRPEALPAVTEPSFLNAGFMAASCSRDVARGCSSTLNSLTPLRSWISTVAICSLK
ncbi:hypothetical protein D3C87_1475400 [compost metagenome]